MTERTIDAAAIVDQRLALDGITVDAEERERLISLVPVVREWVKRLTIPEIRYAEPALTHPVK